eukprot:2394906-Amphidinium_carterae.1
MDQLTETIRHLLLKATACLLKNPTSHNDIKPHYWSDMGTNTMRTILLSTAVTSAFPFMPGNTRASSSSGEDEEVPTHQNQGFLHTLIT